MAGRRRGKTAPGSGEATPQGAACRPTGRWGVFDKREGDSVFGCSRQPPVHGFGAGAGAAVGVFLWEQNMTTGLKVSAAEQTVAARGASARGTAEAAVDVVAKLAELTGLPFVCVDLATGRVVERSGEVSTTESLDPELLRWTRRLSEPAVLLLADTSFYAIPLDRFRCEGFAAVGPTTTLGVGANLSGPSSAVLQPSELSLTDGNGRSSGRGAGSTRTSASSDGNPSALLTPELERLAAELGRKPAAHCVPHKDPRVLQRLLRLAVDFLESCRHEDVLRAEVDSLSEEIDRTYEEISLLHDLTRNLNISQHPRDLIALCLDRMQELIPAEGHAVWLRVGEKTEFLTAGRVPLSEQAACRLMGRLLDGQGTRPLVKNRLSGTLLGADFPGLENLIGASIAEGGHSYGWILSCNCRDGQEFGSAEAALLHSIATILGTHLRNTDLYQQHQELLFSFVRSLVSALDARDPYTRGHSERVALIARRLGEELQLPEEDLETLYRAGLLHDIGKVGVDDSVLRKESRLTEREFEHIKQHPMIGYLILAELKNLQDVLPGVRNHHENYAGGGYPDGLAGDEIPLIARIIAVADAYDAMRSDRPYRKGMPLERVEQIFRDGSGRQWDARIIDAYFRARDDIERICREYSPEATLSLVARARRESAQTRAG